MPLLPLDRLLEFLTGQGFYLGLLWLGVAVITLALARLMFTRWGLVNPLRKCLVLSLMAHLLLAGYSATVRIIDPSGAVADDRPVSVTVAVETDDNQDPAKPAATGRRAPWESFDTPTNVRPPPAELARAEPQDMSKPQRRTTLGQVILPDDALDSIPLAEAPQPSPQALPAQTTAAMVAEARPAATIEPPQPEQREGPHASMPSQAQAQRVPPAFDFTDTVARRTQGRPSALLEQAVHVPRLVNAETVSQPQEAMPDVTDSLEQPNQRRPADWVDPRGSPGIPPDIAYGPRQTAPQPATDHLRPPAMAASPAENLAEPDSLTSLLAADSSAGAPRLPSLPRRPGEQTIPEAYRLRVAPDRARLAQQAGATQETERAVQAALQWLAANQSPDGRWDPRRHEAGRERMVLGRDRQGAGSQADTGITGLALLVFLAAGHTHDNGPYQATVRKGLQFLLLSQGADGNLGGKGQVYEFMYCHGIATLALSEALGMTSDERLRQPVRKAIGYTLAAQNPTTGGWRYRPGDPGDTSQLGWQLMALTSAELAGVPMPDSTRQAATRFLESVSSGSHGGYAAYRPQERASRPMTAEALLCRQLLGLPAGHPAAREAGDYLLGEIPGEGQTNLYYWYYATLAMHSLQGTHWEVWNRGMRNTLVASQEQAGPLAGSWDPDGVWGAYGGRVYNTALAALCLEVYYRYLPIYAHTTPPG